MDINEFLVVGDRVDVEFNNNFYRTIVQDILHEDVCLLSQIVQRGVPVYVRPGTDVRLTFFRSNGLFHFPVRMDSYMNVDNLVMMKMVALGYPVKQQRRNSFRLDVRLPVYCRIYDDLDDMAQDVVSEFKSSVLDISEGGMKIALSQPLQAGTRLHGELVLNTWEPAIEVDACVQHVIYPEAPHDTYKAGLLFTAMPESKRRLIGRFIMTEQARVRKA